MASVEREQPPALLGQPEQEQVAPLAWVALAADLPAWLPAYGK
jgi:hypothetical protein